MKLFIHVGLNKSGSTSFQNLLTQQKSELLEKFGIFYSTEQFNETFQNHYPIYASLTSGDTSACKALIKEYIYLAEKSGAKSAIISTEDLFFITGNSLQRETFRGILDEIKNITSIEILIVLRRFTDWALSYIKQIIANGSFNPNDGLQDYHSLSTFLAKGIQYFEELPYPMKIYHMESSTSSNSFLNGIFKTLGFDTNYPERKDNIGSGRYFIAEAMTGIVCGLHAKNFELHPNSPKVDQLRARLRNIIDERAEDIAFSEVLNSFEDVLKSEILKLIDASVKNLDPIDKLTLESYGIL